MIKSKKSRKSILIACIIFALIISIMGTALAATSLVIPGYSNGPGQVTLAVPTMWDGQGVFFIVSKIPLINNLILNCAVIEATEININHSHAYRYSILDWFNSPEL